MVLDTGVIESQVYGTDTDLELDHYQWAELSTKMTNLQSDTSCGDILAFYSAELELFKVQMHRKTSQVQLKGPGVR